MREAFALNKQFVLAMLGVAVLLVAVLPLAHAYDGRVDAQRPLYQDRAAMAVEQFQYFLQFQQVQPMTVQPGESVQVLPGEVPPFTASAASTVEVTNPEGALCVRARDEEADHSTGWRCWELGVNPAMDAGYKP